MGYFNKAIVIFLFINIFTSLAMEILNDADLTDFNDIGNDLVVSYTILVKSNHFLFLLLSKFQFFIQQDIFQRYCVFKQ